MCKFVTEIKHHQYRCVGGCEKEGARADKAIRDADEFAKGARRIFFHLSSFIFNLS